MSKKKSYKPDTSSQKAEEPAVAYNKRELIFFNSFEEQEAYELKKMAEKNPSERINKLEQMRKFFLREFLLPNGEWPPLNKVIKIISGTKK